MGGMKALLVLLLVEGIVGPPPVKRPEDAGAGPHQNETKDWNLGLDYNKYLQEVVQVLESDPEFRKKLESAKVEEIRDGTIAKELEFLSHGVRTKLDEVKRGELERLRHLAQKQYELSQGIDKKHMKIPRHVELKHPTFEVADLQKLIKQTTDDLEEADKSRKDEFKKYEMEKKFEKDMRLKAINDTDERKVVQEEMEKMEAKHKNHEKLNHPMTKDQLETVWEEQDHMDAKDWDPKTFFAMHDLDGNGQWDETEVRILFKKELDKAYDPNAPEDDMKEREEEMERMREHVFKESDQNKDRMISYDEFLTETQRDEFEKDPGWDTMDDEDLYTDEEFENFEHEREAQMPAGYGAYPNIPAMPPVGYGHPGGLPPQGYPPQGMPPQGYPPHPAAYAPPQAALYPPQPQAAYPAQMHPAQFAPGPPMPTLDRNGVPMHGSVPGQPANPQFQPGQQGGQPQQVQGAPQRFPAQGQPLAQPQQGQGQPLQGQPMAQPQQGQPMAQPQQGQGQPQPQQGQPRAGQPVQQAQPAAGQRKP